MTMTYSATWFGITTLIFSLNALAGEAEQAFTDELHHCAAYYQIASQVVSTMDAPQMAAVGKRLANSAQQAQQLAKNYEPAAAASDAIATTKQQLMQQSGAQGMGGLMKQYKDLCQTLLNNPQQRLNFWIMSKM